MCETDIPKLLEIQMTRSRSPKYPSMSLSEAIDRVGKIHVPERTNPISRKTAAQHMGYQGISGAADQALGTLVQFGLIERVGAGEVRVSPLALEILHPTSTDARSAALEAAANHSPVFKDLLDRYPPEHHISETALRSHLVREGFLDRAISAVIKAYKATASYLLSETNRDSPPQPNLVTEEETRGQSNVGKAPSSWTEQTGGPDYPSKTTREVIGVGTQSAPGIAGDYSEKLEREWLRLRTGRDAEVRLLVTGVMDPRGIGHLIRLLTAQKEILEEEQAFFEAPKDSSSEEESK